MPKVSPTQAANIRAWLEKAGFEPETEKADEESWKRENCTVRLIPERKHVRVGIRDDLDSEPKWRSLDQILTMRADWPDATTTTPIELATAPERHKQRRRLLFTRAPGAWLYQTTKPWAHLVKVIMQMLVGIGAVIAVASHITFSATSRASQGPIPGNITHSVNTIAYALAVAAAIELAYTLFTPGPDEALDPLMLGLAAGILLLLTRPDVPVAIQYAGVITGVIALAGLFLIRRYLLADEDE